jgi:AcrR family transcriptional regulator
MRQADPAPTPEPAAPTAGASGSTPTTRERLIAAAIDLFAENGYEGTSVGEIEAAAGLVPRSGALYKHFPSKRALLGAALAERMDAIDLIDARMDLLPVGDLDEELRTIGRLALEELESERQLARIVMKEGDRFPEIAADFHDAIVARGRAISIAWFTSRAAALGVVPRDPEATAEVMADALIGRTLQSFMFGERLGRVEEERFLGAWVRFSRTALESREGT